MFIYNLKSKENYKSFHQRIELKILQTPHYLHFDAELIIISDI